MSRIILFDPNCYKFTDDMVEHWEKEGHEVKKTLYYDPAMVDWADIIWFETADHNLEVATNTGEVGWKLQDMDMSKKKVICRIIDIEAWCGLHNNVDWDYVDEVIFIAPHIKALVEGDVTLRSSCVIPPGVNMNKFTFRKKPVNNKHIAWVAERWYAKGIDYFLQFAAMLYKRDPEYKITAVGIWADNATGGWYRAYIDQFIEQNPMNVEFIEHVDSCNIFLEDVSMVTCFSKKETFSYAIAEGMSKGCKPIIHNFYGSNAIWPKRFIWNTLDEAIDMVFGEYNPEVYRIEVGQYESSKMLKEFDKIIERSKDA
jgi:glycosyltransferase involved in cell wall biosynthesis